MIKIALVDDHQLFREGLGSLLSKHEDFEVDASFDNGSDFIKALEEGYSPSIVLLDLNMPVMSGFEVLEKLKKTYKSVKSIALSMHDDGQYVQKCVRLGAYSYLLKNADESELLLAIHSVIHGKKFFPQNITEIMISNMTLEGKEVKKLSERETEVLQLVTEGKTTKEIAELLFISTRTVETHRNNMMRKLDVSNSAELISKALQLKLL